MKADSNVHALFWYFNPLLAQAHQTLGKMSSKIIIL